MKSATAMLRTAIPQYTNDQAHPCWEGSFLHCACAWQRNANATTKDAITNDALVLPIGHLRDPDRKGWSQRVRVCGKCVHHRVRARAGSACLESTWKQLPPVELIPSD